MLIQAAGLALLAALSPTALLVAAVYLGSARPRLTGAFYRLGAVIMSLVMALVILAILRGVHLNHKADHTPLYGLRLGLGILLLGFLALCLPRSAVLLDEGSGDRRSDDLARCNGHSVELAEARDHSWKP